MKRFDERFATRRLRREKCVRSERAEDADDKDNHRSSEWGVQRREQQKTPKTGETETETFASRRRDQKKMRPMSRPRKRACYNCTSGGVAKCDKVGFVPAKNTLFTFRLPFGWTREGREDETTTKMKKKKGGKKDAEANTLERCSVCSANGKLACGRCNGQGVLLYRSADWR